MSTPPIQYAGPTISPEVPWEIRRHLQLFYQKLSNHTQAFALQKKQLDSIQTSSTTNIVDGGGGGSVTPPATDSIGTVDDQTGNTSVTTQPGDYGALVVLNDASPIAVTLSAAATPWFCWLMNMGAGTATLTPAAPPSGTSTISYTGNPAVASMPLLGGYGCAVYYDGTNWFAWTEPIVPVSFASVAHEWLNSYDATTGLFTASQPDFADISGTAGVAQIGTGTPGAGKYVDGGTGAWTALPVVVLSGTSSSIGGSPIIAGQTITTTVTVTGATTSMVATCSPETYPGDGCNWDAYVSAADTVTVRLTAVIALTPTASVYNVRVLV